MPVWVRLLSFADRQDEGLFRPDGCKATFAGPARDPALVLLPTSPLSDQCTNPRNVHCVSRSDLVQALLPVTRRARGTFPNPLVQKIRWCRFSRSSVAGSSQPSLHVVVALSPERSSRPLFAKVN